MLNIEEYLKYNLNYSYKLINSHFHYMSFIFKYSKISWCFKPAIWKNNVAPAQEFGGEIWLWERFQQTFSKQFISFIFRRNAQLLDTLNDPIHQISLSNTFCCDWHFLTFSLSLCISKFLYASHSSVSLFLFSFVTFSLLFISPSPFTGSTN